ncbi:hypothetical protein Sango_0365500 [Sesamum angolense]|uniref:DUF4283 domain-containing protein n=1 Tax=Sesamum angolense TaxID=2727404 RepID=A0AAE1X9Q0_9LAMI|nr:hypothetical protein Sango_0365500 [Sesamum angolense]
MVSLCQTLEGTLLDWGQNELLLVGQLLSHRSTNFDALKNVLSSLLQPVKGLFIHTISEDRFYLQFNHCLDKQRTLEGRPWTFDKNLLIMESVDNGVNPIDVCLDWSPFRVYVHDIPLSFQTREMANHIGNKLGQFVVTELYEYGSNWSLDWRLRINLNVSKPLKRVYAYDQQREKAS